MKKKKKYGQPFENYVISIFDFLDKLKTENEQKIQMKINKQLLLFYGYILTDLHQVSQKNTSQLVYLSLVDEWCGLSWCGRKIHAALSNEVTHSTQQRIKNRFHADAFASALKHVLLASRKFIWIDNFTKTFQTDYAFNWEQLPYILCNITVVGALVVKNDLHLETFLDTNHGIHTHSAKMFDYSDHIITCFEKGFPKFCDRVIYMHLQP